MRRSERAIHLGGLGLLLVVALAIGATVFAFSGGFDNYTTVKLVAARAGLVMNPDAKVRYRGLQVGRVSAIKYVDGHVELDLNIDTANLKNLPANVGATIRSNTVFGAKTVELTPPAQPSPTHLAAGSEIAATRVQVELNSLYQRLVTAIAQSQPDKLNATLGALTEALSGRGAAVGDGLQDLSQFLAKFNQHTPQFQDALKQFSVVTTTYGAVMPNLMRILDNVVTTGNTLRANSSNLDALLVNVTGLADTTNGIFGPKADDIIALLANAAPTAQLLGDWAPGVKCFFVATDLLGQRAEPVVGKYGLLKLNSGVLAGKDPYRYPYNLPKVNEQAPPTCEGLTDPNHYTDVGFDVLDNAAYPYVPRTKPAFAPNKVFDLLFGPLPNATPGGTR